MSDGHALRPGVPMPVVAAKAPSASVRCRRTRAWSRWSHGPVLEAAAGPVAPDPVAASDDADGRAVAGIMCGLGLGAAAWGGIIAAVIAVLG